MKSYKSRMTAMLRTVLPNRIDISHQGSSAWVFSIGGDNWTAGWTEIEHDLRSKITGSRVADLLSAACTSKLYYTNKELRLALQSATKHATLLAANGWVEGQEP